MKASGLGRRHGEHGILEYTESQSTAVEPALPAGAPDGVDPGRYARLASAGLKILKHLPGIK
ncbi:hypothetical protein [Streptomyces sp. NPDC088746]|uniref:hypothetical protein n=1 Tax=Streptomyces sp. NPDC088746 TaxID=3365885 RepID=UPI003818FC94